MSALQWTCLSRSETFARTVEQALVVSSTGSLIRSISLIMLSHGLAEAGEFMQFFVDFGRTLMCGGRNRLVFGVLFLQFVDDAAKRLEPRDDVTGDGASLVCQLLDGICDNGKAAVSFPRVCRHYA